MNADTRTIETKQIDRIWERVAATADAIMLAMVAFSGVLEECSKLYPERDPEELDISPELSGCMEECMLGDWECVSACIEQAKLAAA